MDSPVQRSTEERPPPAPDSGNNEDTPIPSEGPDENLKPEGCEPANQKGCLSYACLTIHRFKMLCCYKVLCWYELRLTLNVTLYSSEKSKGKKGGKDSKKNGKSQGGVEVAQEVCTVLALACVCVCTCEQAATPLWPYSCFIIIIQSYTTSYDLL